MSTHELAEVERLRRHLAQSRRLYEVRDDGQGGRHWQEVGPKDFTPLEPEGDPPPFSAKLFFFAERELLFRFDGGQFYSSLPEVRPQAIFGLHACDLQAIAYQDRFFAQDPHYQARRHATLLVGVECRESCSNGFCSLVESGPLVGDGLADLVLVRRDDARGWWLRVGSAAGAEAIRELRLPTNLDGCQATRESNAARVALAQLHDRELLDGVAALNAGQVSADTWETLGTHCFGCSGCTQVCPTCSCFAPLEQVGASGEVQHERVWDSCLYEGFQAEASGHNPSASPGQRVQRFWLHKFGEPFREQFGHYGCVGCGRCDRVCPGGIGVHGVIGEVGRP
ncbi:4Fe-4S dicluster domain-containing protein [Pseudomonas indica]|uniref:4Fe-4S dicluster containing protein n=1 Tax=Pseudomonas indica TaxID=137658 RepID=A0A1G9BVX7_9PSED|nr:4Fe-4S dicluster domain-containing protein [Pseudomonas indica]SDK43540.1 4Fe-4S dicluster containing protein [Pseudomonas indica]